MMFIPAIEKLSALERHASQRWKVVVFNVRQVFLDGYGLI